MVVSELWRAIHARRINARTTKPFRYRGKMLKGADMGLFEQGNFRLHSGSRSWFKIECSYLSDSDWRTIAQLVAEQLDFKDAVGIPSGGLRLAEALKFYRKDSERLPTLIVDDVLTTGASLERERQKIGGYCIGIVLFARGECPNWVWPVFQMQMQPIQRRGRTV